MNKDNFVCYFGKKCTHYDLTEPQNCNIPEVRKNELYCKHKIKVLNKNLKSSKK